MHRIYLSAVVVAAFISNPSHAAPTLKDAVQSAWAKHPLAQARGSRLDEGAAKRDVAASWLADAPRISVSQKTDRVDQNKGAREWEAEIGAAIQLPALRSARTAVAENEAAAYDAEFSAEKWRLAGEVREAFWMVQIAANEATLAERKVTEARALSSDVARRFKAGDVARTDSNQAEANVKLAELTDAEAQGKLFRAKRNFLGLTGLSQMAEGDERPAEKALTLEQHPRMVELARNADAARTRQQEANANRRDPPEISLGMIRERAGYGESSLGSVVMRLTIPLASGARNRVRQATAGAERTEAETRVLQTRARIEADIAASQEDVTQSTRQVEFAEARFKLISETHKLFEKAYQLGELDLPARLRAEADRYDAELSLSRSRIEAARNISRLNQSSGVLP
jgi:outer membrane protein, heavy metal efflux system